MPTLVTGANGHVGSNLVRELLARGREVVAFVRKGSDTSGLEGLPVERRHGDVLDRDSVMAAARGCDAIAHLAAVYETHGKRSAEIMRPAVEGTSNVLEAAAAHGIRRVVMTSSIVAVGFNRTPDAPARTEEQWNDEPHIPYFRAKTESERLAWHLAGKLGLELVTVLPGGVLGPHDYRITPTTRYVRELANRRALTGRGGFCYIDVRDVAWVHAAALERGVPGERYLVTLPVVEFRRLGEMIGEHTGRRPRHIGAPRSLALATIAVQSSVQRLFRIPPPLTFADAREGAGRWASFDASKAERTFGYTPRPVERVVGDALRWLADREQLEPEVKERVLASLGA